MEAHQKSCTIKQNTTKNSPPESAVIHRLFEQQVEKTPDNIALKCGDQRLTYRELNAKANQLAHCLVSRYDLTDSKLIALVLDRSENLLIAILAILKMGCAYIPIDPSYPDERVAYLVGNSQAKIILTSTFYEKKLSQLAKQKMTDSLLDIFPLDAESVKKESASQPVENLDIKVSAKDLAYVIYTSGTTGNPKGVMIEHAGVVNRIQWMNDKFPLTESDVILHKTPYSFDVSVWELLWANWYGASVFFAKPGGHKDPNYIADLIFEKSITIIHFVPSMLSVFSDTLEIQQLSGQCSSRYSSLKYLFCSGEALSLSQVKSAKALLPSTEIHNLYGPTEASIDATHFDCNDPDLEKIYIGKPITNMKCYVLDEKLNLCPIGDAGELHIAGVGLARGYLGRRSLTQEKFIENPFQVKDGKSADSFERLYKTGDVVRRSPNGDLEYLGRNDFQIKLRGFRVELGEIENTVLKYQLINQALVAVHEKYTTKFIVCYYVAKGEVNEHELKQHLQLHLPEYMVPHVFMKLDKFPLTANGKLDRANLPDPLIFDARQYIAPRNQVEANICKIWALALGMSHEQLGLNDNFFELGGDSIIAIQIVSKLRQELGICISVKDIFVCKNIATLFDNVIKNNQNANKKLVLKTEEGLLAGPLNLLPIQDWFFKNRFKIQHHYNQSFAIKIPHMELAELENCLTKLIKHHDAFRLRYKRQGSNYSQYYDEKAETLSLKVLDVVSLGHENSLEFKENLQEILTQWQSNFNIETGPLCGLVYLHGYSDGSAMLHFSLHHLIVDSVSWRILVEDFKACYEKKALPEKASSYRQWVNSIEEYTIKNPQERKYWLEVIKDFENKSIHGLPEAQVTTASARIVLSKAQTMSLLRNCHATYNTEINDLLLTALSYALKEVTNKEVNHIVLEGHGREEIDRSIDISRTMGWFTTLFPVRLDVKESLADTIKLTKEMLRNIPAKGVGFGALFGCLPENLPKISFNYLGLISQESIQGVTDNLWQIVSTDESAGYSISEMNADCYDININGLVIGGKLQFSVSSKLNTEKTQSFANRFKECLLEVLKHITDQNRSYLTCSDINKIINQEHLDKLQKNSEIEGVYLASSLQQGFVYHALKQGHIDDSYIVQFMWEYHTKIEPDKLKMAWEYAQQKFASLRLRFFWGDGSIVQIIDKIGEVEWEFIDLSEEASLDCQSIKLKKLQETDRLKPYNLERGSLFRLHLIKQNDDLYTFLFSHHHAILDGWGNVALLDYIHKTYLDLVNFKQIHILADKSYEMAQVFLQERKDKDLEFWKRYISKIESKENLTGLLSLDAENKNLIISDHKHTIQSKDCSLFVEGELLEKLKAVCKQESITLNAIMQYTWHKMLGLYGNSEKTVAGTTFSGRNLPIDAIDSSVGLYINTLPFIVEHSSDELIKVIDVIKKIQEDTNELRARTNLALSSLQKGGKRLFNSLFAYEKFIVTESNRKNEEKLNIVYKQSIEVQDYPLGVVIYEGSDRLKFRLKYAGELFDELMIEQIIQNIESILWQIAKKPQCLESSVNLLLASQHTENISGSCSSSEELKYDTTLHQLFQDRVKQVPHEVAVLFEDQEITYKELDEKSNQLAHYLKEIGVGSDDLVAIVVDRSIEMIIGMMGILKAGAAYVPIDPSYPMERFTFILDDAAVSIILTDTINEDKIPATFAMMILLDEDLSIFSSYPVSPLSPSNSSNNLAYVIYTSGTTGLPKGVMIEHKSVVNLINYLTLKYEIKKNDSAEVILNFSSFVFDASVEQIYLALLNGCRLLLIPNELWKNSKTFHDYLNKNKVTHVHSTPNFLEQYDFSGIKSIKRIISGGDMFSRELCNKLKSLQGVTIVNEYGPTETTITSSVNIIGGKGFGIGHPVANTRCYVLDEKLRQLPAGAIGELYIAGVGLARGYLNKPALTQASFIDNPFQAEDEKRTNQYSKLYKTGDLVSRKLNGDLNYVGRNDYQIKLRGYRIELGEIERNVSDYEGVTSSVVVVKVVKGAKSLVCYYLSDKKINNNELKFYLQSKLPDYMIPHAFLWLEKYPLLASGKLDRQALPEPNYLDEDSYVAPRDDLEKQACQIWAEVLGVSGDQVSINDDFFELGGDSISAIKLVTKLNKQCHMGISIADIFDKKTIRNIMDLAKNSTNVISTIRKCLLQKEDQKLSYAQERLWFINEFEGGSNAYNIPLFFKMSDGVDISTLCKSIEEVIRRHEPLRTIYKKTANGDVYQNVVELDTQNFEIITYEVKSSDELHKKFKEAAHATFDLSSEIPFRASVYKLLLSEDSLEHYLCIIIHHICFDGWSSNVFVNDIYSYYTYYKGGSVNEASLILPDLPITYKDFSSWQRKYLDEGRLKQDLAYWKSELKDFVPVNIALDKPRPENANYAGLDQHFELDESVTSALRDYSKKLKMSLYSILLSGFYLLLRRISRQNDIIIGFPIANRHYPDVENIIGFFVNALPLRVKFDSNLSLENFILSVSGKIIEAQKHQDLPFEKLVEELEEDKDVSRHPIFQHIFGLQSFGENSLGKCQELMSIYQSDECSYDIAKTDLSIYVDDTTPRLTGVFNYSTSIFENATIDSFIKIYINIIRQFASNPHKKIDNLTYFSQSEHEKLTCETDRSNFYLNKDKKSIVEIFNERAEKKSNKVALKFDSKKISYVQLKDEVRHLTELLHSKADIKQGDYIAVLTDKKEDLVITMLSVFASNCFFVPIDSNRDIDCINYILRELNPKIIITRDCFIKKNDFLKSKNLFLLEELFARDEIIKNGISIDNLSQAYSEDVGFSSYEYGDKKISSIMLSNQPLVLNAALHLGDKILSEQCGELMLVHNGFIDESIIELLTALLSGVTLNLSCFSHGGRDIKPNTHLSHAKVDSVLMISGDPTELINAELPSLKLLILNNLFFNYKKYKTFALGKSIYCYHGSVSTGKYILEQCIDYSSSPCKIVCTPVENISTYILDEFSNLLPVGVVGNLHIAGASLPYSINMRSSKNEKLRKTNLLARSKQDGCVEIMGFSIDFDSVYGYQEISCKLNYLLSLLGENQECMVVNYIHENRLVPVFLHKNKKYSRSKLQDIFKDFLPENWLPKYYYNVMELPLASSGVASIAASPEFSEIFNDSYVAPRTDVERYLCQIWSEALNVSQDEISINHSFFRLGGSSISALRLAMKISIEYKITFTVLDVFNNKKLHEMSNKIICELSSKEHSQEKTEEWVV